MKTVDDAIRLRDAMKAREEITDLVFSQSARMRREREGSAQWKTAARLWDKFAKSALVAREILDDYILSFGEEEKTKEAPKFAEGDRVLVDGVVIAEHRDGDFSVRIEEYDSTAESVIVSSGIMRKLEG